MSMTTRSLRAIDTSDARNASSASQRSAQDHAPLTATFETATAAYYDRPDRVQPGYLSAYPYDPANDQSQQQQSDSRRATQLDHPNHGQQPYATGEASSSESGLPYDEPDHHAPRLQRSTRLTPNPPALVYDPDYVIAMHDFVPEVPNVTCLAFSAGEVIHVLNRDPTGWWDGELDTRRGWFPSNYVSADAAAFAAAAELAGFAVAHVADVPSQSSGQQFAATHNVAEGSSTGAKQRKKVLADLARLVGQARQASESKESKLAAVDPDAKRAQLLDPERVKQLSEMVRLGDTVYQQVKKFLTLAVSCGIELPQDRVFADAPGMGDLMHATVQDASPAEAESVAGPSRIEQRVSNAVAPAVTSRRGHTRRSSSMSDLNKERAAEAIGNSKASSSRDLGGGYDEAQSPTSPTSSQGTSTPSATSDGQGEARSDWLPRGRETSSSTYRPRNPGEMRRQKSLSDDLPTRASIEFHPAVAGHQSNPLSLSSQKQQSWGSRSLAIQATFNRAPSTRQAVTSYRKPKFSISSVSSLSSYDSSQMDSGSPPFDSPAVFPSGLTTTVQALATLRITHDRLLSVIAAFIGHIHSHSRSSHASSKGHLIEMTRKTVDQVRFLLTLVDAVEEHEGICEDKPREMAMLKTARVALYNSTNDIVEGVKDMMSPPEGGAVSEEEEKSRALQAATGTLRAGGDCVKSVNMCLSTRIGGEPFLISIAAVPGADADMTVQPSTTPPSATSTHASTSPPRTPKSPFAFRRAHAHSMSHPHPHGTHSTSKHSHSSSVGGSSLRTTRRPQSDISPIRGEGPSRRRAEMVEGVTEIVNEDVLEDGEATAILETPRDLSSSMALPDQDEDSTVPEDDQPLSETSDALSTTSALPRLVVSDASFTKSDQPSSQSSNGTTVSQLSMQNEDQVSNRTSIDTTDVFRPIPEISEQEEGLVINGEDRHDNTEDEADVETINDTHEGEEMSQVLSATSALEEKLIHGDLPATPSAPPEFVDAVYDPRDLLINDSQQLVAASLEVMTIKLAPLSFTPDRPFVIAFLLTFRLFTTSTQLAEALIQRWNAAPPPTWPETERRDWHSKIPFMRIRVARCIKTWIDHFWLYETDDQVLPRLQTLVDQPLPDDADISLSNIVVVIRSLVYSELARASRNGERPMDRAKAAAGHLFPGGSREGPVGDIPTPIVKRAVHSRLGAMDLDTPITELDALEVARQLTLMEAQLYCEIPAQELVELGKQGAKSTNVKAISTFSTAITGWVSESILNEPDGKKRSALLKYFIKLADRCVGLHNYSTMRSVLAALDSSTISRLTKTWTYLSAKYKAQLDTMRTLTDHAKNYAIYREALRATQPPAVPFLGLYLTDLTFCREGNPNTRPSPLEPARPLINFIKYYRLARIVQDVQRFQSTPYSLQPVPEIQKYLSHVIEKGKNTGDLHDLYRRSLVLEPRQASDAVPPDSKSGLLGWATRNQS
ncbi:hypothetical protein FRB97_006257 [Tulasnella sp. 331]|nr:hypothetical protein FRB97_006257 [Tulasnella sp. 331]